MKLRDYLSDEIVTADIAQVDTKLKVTKKKEKKCKKCGMVISKCVCK